MRISDWSSDVCSSDLVIAEQQCHAADPPALPRQAIGLAHHQHREVGLAIKRAQPVDLFERLANRAHLGTGEAETEVAEQFGIADAASLTRRRDQYRADARRVAERRHVGRAFAAAQIPIARACPRSEEHTSELQSLM